MRTEDGYLVGKCLDGDPAAFNILVDRYKEGIYSLVYSKILNFHDAEDITQEVFLKAYQNLKSLRRWDRFPAWLYAIASNLCKNWLIAHSKRPDQISPDDDISGTIDEVSLERYGDELVQDELSEAVHEALNALPEIYRQVLSLSHLGGLSGREISVLLGISPTAASKRLTRARSMLKGEMLNLTSLAFEQNKLQVGFTIRIAELVKGLKIQPLPKATTIPLGIGLALGAIIIAISLTSSHKLLEFLTSLSGNPLPVKQRILEAGEIPVDVLDDSIISIISSKDDKGEDNNTAALISLEYNVSDISIQGDSDGKPANPVLDRGPLGTWDWGGTHSPSVIFDGSGYKMWYRGFVPNNFGYKEASSVGYATSDDGVSWEKYFGNPVLTQGDEGEWDGKGIMFHNVIFVQGEYKMWYTGASANNGFEIGYASSPDGISWRKYSGNPVLRQGSEGEWDSYNAFCATVIFDGREYKMWYTGVGPIRKTEIGYAVSLDGISWLKYAGNPIFKPDLDNTPNSAGVGIPFVLFSDNQYKMWYGEAVTGSGIGRIGYATSRDGIAWNRYPGSALVAGKPDTWDSLGPGNPCVVFDGSRYRMWYAGYDNLTTNRIGYASGDNPDSLEATDPMLTRNSGPGTWMPYKLSEGTEVKLIIYKWLKYEGEPVRTMNLGFKPAGDYTSKDKAEYWDGRDDNGNPLPAGLYDCVIEAGGHTGSRRLSLNGVK